MEELCEVSALHWILLPYNLPHILLRLRQPGFRLQDHELGFVPPDFNDNLSLLPPDLRYDPT